MFIPLGVKSFLIENVCCTYDTLYVHNLVRKHFIWPITW